jgi:hypothetical protein
MKAVTTDLLSPAQLREQAEIARQYSAPVSY